MEEWKVVPSAPNYEASTHGQIRRLTAALGTVVGKIIKPRDFRGYDRYCLYVNRKKRMFSGHRLCAEAFFGEIPEGMQINHLNGVKNDNRIVNLEICTPSENTRHGFRVLGRKPVINRNPGEANGRAKLRDSDMPLLYSMREQGMSQQKIADHFRVSQAVISRVLLGLTGFRDPRPHSS